MDANIIAYLIITFILFGWIPILAIGKAIAMCIEVKTCGGCTCKTCEIEEE